MNENLKIAIEAAIEAGRSILEIYDSGIDFNIQNKDDNSPLTIADKASNAVINAFLEKTGVPIISEENRQIEYAVRSSWNLCWIVDPLDGTKEFIKRNGEFTVNIALCEKGVPILGVIYVPVTRELYYADVSIGKAYKTQLSESHMTNIGFGLASDELAPAAFSPDRVRVVGSRSHMNPETEDFIKSLSLKHREVEIVSKGSSLKFCLVAEGKADVYPRYAPTMEWDTAAGSAIVEALGLQVISKETNKPLRYNKENLLNPHFLVGR
jgi:3'(2'), 5'-bisphosphate nucleotidase